MCALSLGLLPVRAFAEEPAQAGVEIAGGASIAGGSFLGIDFSGAGPYASVRVRAAEGLDLELDYRRHDLRGIQEDAAADSAARATSRLVSVLVRHSIFTLRGKRYLDLHAGLASERFAPEDGQPRTRRSIRLGVAMLQPGSMYHLSDHLELRIGIDVLVSRAWTAPAPAGCTGPCSAPTSGRTHDFGFLGTFAIGLR